jgi:hypothetical protein
VGSIPTRNILQNKLTILLPPLLLKFSATKKFLETKYNSKYRFSYPDYKIIIERIVKKPGIQMNIFDIIKE